MNKQSTKLRNRRKNVHLNSDTDDSEPREFEGDSNKNRTRRATTQNGPARRSRVNRYDQETKDDSELNENIGNYPRTTTHFPFGMTQTPFQIMSNWPLKFRNNKEDSPAHFLYDLKIFKRRYQISSRHILENLDALLTEDAKDLSKTTFGVSRRYPKKLGNGAKEIRTLPPLEKPPNKEGG